MNRQLVVAKYKEDISWLKNIDQTIDICIYDKDNNTNSSYYKLPNVGRESHTYLYHIINYYDNLSDFTFFVQGDPFPHCEDIINEIHNTKCFPTFFGKRHIEKINSITCEHHPNGLPLYYFFMLLFDINLNDDNGITFRAGAQFGLDKETILSRPINFYKFLLKFLLSEKSPIEAYIFERLWPYIFNKNIPISQKYEAFI